MAELTKEGAKQNAQFIFQDGDQNQKEDNGDQLSFFMEEGLVFPDGSVMLPKPSPPRPDSPIPPEVPMVKCKLQGRPYGLATVQFLTPEYRLLLAHSAMGSVLSFTKETQMEGGSLMVDDLSDIFRLGDIVFIEGASHFTPRVWPDVQFHVRHLLWVSSGN